MQSRIVTCCKNFQILICSPFNPINTGGGGGRIHVKPLNAPELQNGNAIILKLGHNLSHVTKLMTS